MTPGCGLANRFTAVGFFRAFFFFIVYAFSFLRNASGEGRKKLEGQTVDQVVPSLLTHRICFDVVTVDLLLLAFPARFVEGVKSEPWLYTALAGRDVLSASATHWALLVHMLRLSG